jgi:hypothetical protein
LFRETQNVIFEWKQKQSRKHLVEMHLDVSKFCR